MNKYESSLKMFSEVVSAHVSWLLCSKAVALEEIAKCHETHNHLKGLEAVEKLSEVETACMGRSRTFPPSKLARREEKESTGKAVLDLPFLHALQPLAIFAAF